MIHKIFLFLRRLWAEYGNSILIGAFLGFSTRFIIDNPVVIILFLFVMFPILNFIILNFLLFIWLAPFWGVVLEIFFRFIQTRGFL